MTHNPKTLQQICIETVKPIGNPNLSKEDKEFIFFIHPQCSKPKLDAISREDHIDILKAKWKDLVNFIHEFPYIETELLIRIKSTVCILRSDLRCDCGNKMKLKFRPTFFNVTFRCISCGKYYIFADTSF